MIDYDLVVLGSGSVARWAAATAARWQARVAQVPVVATAGSLELSLPLRFATQRLDQVQALEPLWASPVRLTLDREKMGRWAEQVTASLQSTPTVSQLSSLGVDWVPGEARFVPKPRLSLQVGDRELRSRRYLLLLDAAPPVLPPAQLPILNLKQLLDYCQSTQHPPAIGILGDGPLALQFAQSLARLGHQTTLLLPQNRSLLTEEFEAVSYIEAQLEADGIQIVPHGAITAVTPLPSARYQVQTATHTFIADVLLDAREAVPPRELPLNLEALSLRQTPHGLWVNRYLQTSHPQIYASGSILGGYASLDLSYTEARVALRNALLFNCKAMNYALQPRVVWTDPELAGVGLTQRQAQRRYRRIRTLSLADSTLPQALVGGSPFSFGKLIARPNGELVGAHFVGPGAAELIHLLAFACQRRSRLADLAQLVPLFATQSQSLAALLPPVAPLPPTWLERLFNLARDWHLS